MSELPYEPGDIFIGDKHQQEKTVRNFAPIIYKELIASRALVEAVEKMDVDTSGAETVVNFVGEEEARNGIAMLGSLWRMKRDEILRAYREE